MRPPDALPVAQNPGADLETAVDVDQLRQLHEQAKRAPNGPSAGACIDALPALLDAYGELTDLRAENERLSADNWQLTTDHPLRRSYDQLEQRAVGYVARAEEAEAALAVAHDVIRRLREVVEPFVAYYEASMASRNPDMPDSIGVVTHSNSHEGDTAITIGDLRRLVAALDAAAGPDDPHHSQCDSGPNHPGPCFLAGPDDTEEDR